MKGIGNGRRVNPFPGVNKIRWGLSHDRPFYVRKTPRIEIISRRCSVARTRLRIHECGIHAFWAVSDWPKSKKRSIDTKEVKKFEPQSS